MTLAVVLLALLNLQLSAIVGWAVLERKEALSYRADAREHLGSIDDSTLAAWARIAGKVRLEDSGRNSVLAGDRAQDEQAGESDFRKAVVELSHPSIVGSRSDGA